ncbi:HNH endonuclease signature motif containing protein [Streptomyces sp. NPDC059371]|uniref:HNH endonuclease signature motif containing protein n=1 Tax=Streptomyces sp. NPDC059371 TaxID=3346812 RepID=UPI0036755BA6
MIKVGDEFGFWIVQARSEGARYWVRCRCGTEREVYTSSLLLGKTVSCGCMRLMRRHEVGETVGEWEIVSYEGLPSRRAVCKCSCGALKEVDIYTLGRSSKSCGHDRQKTFTSEAGTKRCTACGGVKPLDDFHKDSGSSDGRRPRCKLCVKERDDARREDRNRRAREAYKQNPAAKIEKTRAYHLARPDWSREKARESHLRHADERALRHRERGKDPTVRASRRAASRRAESRRRAIKRLAESEHISEQQLQDLVEQFKGACWICGDLFDAETVVLQVDHYKPLSKGGPHILANLRPVCAECNLRKSGRWPFTAQMRAEVAEAVRRLRAEG